MAEELNLGRAYPLVFPGNLPVDNAISDIFVLIFSAEYDPDKHSVHVTQLTAHSATVRFTMDSTVEVVVPLGSSEWAEVRTTFCLIKLRLGTYRYASQPWVGSAEVEPCRIAIVPNTDQSVEVYNKLRTRVIAKPGCIAPDFGDDEFVDQYGLVLRCSSDASDVVFVGGFSTVVSQYDANAQLTIAGDVGGGEAGRACSGQVAVHADELPPVGASTLDGSPGCSEVLRRVNGVSGDFINFLAGTGASVYPQPEKHRVTVRFDGAGSARCPVTDINRADCPPPYPGYCGPVDAVDICPDNPDDLASIRTPNSIPPVSSLPIVQPSELPELPARLKYLNLRGCSSALAEHDGTKWFFRVPCRPSCYGRLPGIAAVAGTSRSVSCEWQPPDPTIGVRNNDFGFNLALWGVNGSPVQITSHDLLGMADLPALAMPGNSVIYQTEISVPVTAKVKFSYIGRLKFYVASLGRLYLETELLSENTLAAYETEFVIPKNQPISIQFEVLPSWATAIVSLPYMTSVS